MKRRETSPKINIKFEGFYRNCILDLFLNSIFGINNKLKVIKEWRLLKDIYLASTVILFLVSDLDGIR